jgi:predicted nucleic acid-binding protein
MIIADTGFWLALINPHDDFHHAAKNALKKTSEPLITTTPVLTEALHLIVNRVGWPAALKFVESLDRGISQLFEIVPDHFNRVATLMKKYRDLPMDFADASLVILAEDLGTGRIFTTDFRDFRAYRWKDRKPFTNVLTN